MLKAVYRFRALALLLGLVFLGSVLYFQRWNTTIVHGGDSWGYYGYLPAAFIYHDLEDISDSYLKRFDYAGALLPSQGLARAADSGKWSSPH